RYAVRDAFLLPLDPAQVDHLDWYFRYRQGHVVCPSSDPDMDIATARRTFGAARFEAIFRTWQQRGVQALWAVQTPFLKERLQRGDGRIEFAELPHQYLQLTPLVGRTDGVDLADSSGDDLATA